MCLWDARGVRPVHIRSRQILPGEDGGDVGGGDTVKMKMKCTGWFTLAFSG